jgi:MFS family permease
MTMSRPRFRWPKFEGLWRERNFRRFWAAEAISFMGSEVTDIAFPLVAVITLHAAPEQTGLLYAAFMAPGVVTGLFVGVWVDRLRRRPLIIAADLTAAALVLWVPIASALGVLSIEQLYVLGILFGVVGSIWGSAYTAFLPSLVRRDELVDANSKLTATWSLSAIVGPGVGGLLVELVTAPVAMLVDAASYVASAGLLTGLPVQESSLPPKAERPGLAAEIAEGLHVIVSNPIQRSITGIHMILALFQPLIASIYVIFVVRHLHVSPFLFGVITALGAVGFLIGSVSAPRLSRRFGLGRTALAAAVLLGLSPLFLPFARPQHPLAAPVFLIAAAIIGATGDLILEVNLGSLRQAVSPDRLLGRIGASERFFVLLIRIPAAVLGGYLGAHLGLRATIAIGAAGHGLIFVWLALSPLRSLREVPPAVETSEPIMGDPSSGRSLGPDLPTIPPAVE